MEKIERNLQKEG